MVTWPPRIPDDKAFWAATYAAMGASWWHLYEQFGKYEGPGHQPVAALAATAVDLGLLAGMRKVRQWAKDKPQSAEHMRLTVLGLTVASSVANFQHAWAVGSVDVVGFWPLAGVALNSLLVSAILPVIVYRYTHALEIAEAETAAPAKDAPSAAESRSDNPWRFNDPNNVRVVPLSSAAKRPKSKPTKPDAATLADWRRQIDAGTITGRKLSELHGISDSTRRDWMREAA